MTTGTAFASPAVAEYQGVGDLVVFAANKIQSAGNPWTRPSPAAREFVHGMQPVRKGTAPVCERWAIGLLQPRGSKKRKQSAASSGGKKKQKQPKKKK